MENVIIFCLLMCPYVSCVYFCRTWCELTLWFITFTLTHGAVVGHQRAQSWAHLFRSHNQDTCLGLSSWVLSVRVWRHIKTPSGDCLQSCLHTKSCPRQMSHSPWSLLASAPSGSTSLERRTRGWVVSAALPFDGWGPWGCRPWNPLLPQPRPRPRPRPLPLIRLWFKN